MVAFQESQQEEKMFSLCEFTSEARPNGVGNPKDDHVLISFIPYRNREIFLTPP